MAKQLRLPSGPLAPWAARVLNRGNLPLIEHSIDALGLKPDSHVLDVGFGGGVSLGLLLDKAVDGEVFGVEPSPEMIRRAARRYQREVREGRLVLKRGTAGSIPFPDDHLDRVLSVQTIYFWPDTQGGLAEIRRVLSSAGWLAVATMPKHVQQHFHFAEQGHKVFGEEELTRALEEATFRDVCAVPHPAGRGTVVVARKP